jgi:hypothetical protein
MPSAAQRSPGDEITHAVLHTGGNDEVLRLVPLQHHPLHAHMFFGVAPVSQYWPRTNTPLVPGRCRSSSHKFDTSDFGNCVRLVYGRHPSHLRRGLTMLARLPSTLAATQLTWPCSASVHNPAPRTDCTDRVRMGAGGDVDFGLRIHFRGVLVLIIPGAFAHSRQVTRSAPTE